MTGKRIPAGNSRRLRLRTSGGVRHSTLPRAVRGDGHQPPKNAQDFVQESLGRRWKTFRSRMKRGLPRRASGKEIDDAVVGGKAVRRMSKRVGRVLGRLGRLRDLAVEKDMLSRVVRNRRSPGIRSFGRGSGRTRKPSGTDC